jgi:hypothetical protein
MIGSRDISKSMRDNLAAKRTTRDEKLKRVLTRPSAPETALDVAKREAKEARALADEAKAKLGA